MTADFVLAGTGSRSLRTAERAVQVDAMDRCTLRLQKAAEAHGGRLVVHVGPVDTLAPAAQMGA